MEIDLDAELAAALLQRSDESDRLTDMILFAWGDWCGTDSGHIRAMLGVRSIFGAILRGAVKRQETTDDARAVRPQEYYPKPVYQEIERMRQGMTSLQRGVMDCRYRYGHSVRKTVKIYSIGNDRYYSTINEIRAMIRSKIDVTNLLVA